LSISWVVVGAIAFGIGLVRSILEARLSGLGLLALATAKVFLFDLASLEVAYRVISLIALGLLLLTSAWLWQRLQAGAPEEGSPTATDPGTASGLPPGGAVGTSDEATASAREAIVMEPD
jgi:uncharacterized membrane protein